MEYLANNHTEQKHYGDHGPSKEEEEEKVGPKAINQEKFELENAA
jgi:hypothetical protein